MIEKFNVPFLDSVFEKNLQWSNSMISPPMYHHVNSTRIHIWYAIVDVFLSTRIHQCDRFDIKI